MMNINDIGNLIAIFIIGYFLFYGIVIFWLVATGRYKLEKIG